MSNLSVLHRYDSVFNQVQYLRCSRPPEQWGGWLESFDVYTMLPQSCVAMVVWVPKCKIEGKRAGMKCFAVVQLQKRMVSRCFSSPLINLDMYEDEDFQRDELDCYLYV